jgi:chemotaxis protein MotA
MGIANIIGSILGWGLIVATILVLGKGDPGKLLLFVDIPSVFVVIGGSVAACLVGYPLSTILKTHKLIILTYTAKDRSPVKIIEQIVALAEAARREGLLSLENHMDEIDDNPLLATGIRMAVDGMSPEVVESVMNIDLDSVNARHTGYRKILADCGKYAPAFGMMGTVIGLVLMLTNLDPDTLGPGMAVALITTFYGAIMANLTFIPWSDKLALINDAEIQCMEITIKGVIAIQSGENPRVIKQKLLMYLPAAERPTDDEDA